MKRPPDLLVMRFQAFRRLALPPELSLWLARDSLTMSGPKFARHLVLLEQQMIGEFGAEQGTQRLLG